MPCLLVPNKYFMTSMSTTVLKCLMESFRASYSGPSFVSHTVAYALEYCDGRLDRQALLSLWSHIRSGVSLQTSIRTGVPRGRCDPPDGGVASLNEANTRIARACDVVNKAYHRFAFIWLGERSTVVCPIHVKACIENFAIVCYPTTRSFRRCHPLRAHFEASCYSDRILIWTMLYECEWCIFNNCQ